MDELDALHEPCVPVYIRNKTMSLLDGRPIVG